MIKHIDQIKNGLRNCKGHRCRKCIWRNFIDGSCTLLENAAKYIEALENDNAQAMIYCKDCVYCKKTNAACHFDNDKYECKHRDGLPSFPYVDPMDYCSRGVAKKAITEVGE